MSPFLLTESSNKIEIKVDDKVGEVYADKSKLYQVFQNLISNAVKYNQPGVDSRIHISIVDEGASWKFTVKDNGIGIAPEFHEKVFKVFQRLHNDSEYSGTGIGLAICERIVNLHKGTIWIEEGIEGKGCSFNFTFSYKR